MPCRSGSRPKNGGFWHSIRGQTPPAKRGDHHPGHGAFLRTPCLDQAGGRRRLWPFSHNRGHGLVGTDPSRWEPTGRVMTADPRSACGRNPRSEAGSDATAPGPMLTSPWMRFWAVRDPAARGLGTRSPQQNKTAPSDPPWGRMVSAPAFAERGRSQIVRYPRHICSSRVLNRAYRPQKPPIPPFCPSHTRTTSEIRPGSPDRLGPAVKARTGSARRRPAPPGPTVTAPPGPAVTARPVDPAVTTLRRRPYPQRVWGNAARRARPGSTGPVRRAHGAWHRGYRWDLFRWDWSGSASPMR